MTKQDYSVYEEMVISVIADNHKHSNIPLFVTDENLNIWILLRSSFDINGLFSDLFFKGGCKKHTNMKYFNYDMMYCVYQPVKWSWWFCL